MLDSLLISSKVRRTLLEHFLSRPGERFYLRGLAKELNLTISPARRELLHLEQMGVLTAYQEANVRFYVMNSSSPIVAQLKAYQSTGTVTDTAEPEAGPTASAPALPVSATVLTHAKVERMRRALKPATPWPVVVGAVTVIAAMVGVGVVSYLEMTNHRWLSMARDLAKKPTTQVTVVQQPAVATGAAATGEMRSSRWRVVPGGAGTFSPGTRDSY